MSKEGIFPPRLLVIACYPPEGGGGGGVILRSLFKEYPSEQLMWLALRPDRTKRQKWYRPEMARWSVPFYLPSKVARFIGPIGAGLVGALLDWVAVVFAQVAIKRHKPTDVLLVADLYAIRAAGRITSNNPGLRFHLTVHDDPLVTAGMIERPIGLSVLANTFAALCRQAASIDCVSARMAWKYRNEFGVQPLVITRCVEDSYLAAVAQKPIRREHEEINLVQCGWGDCPPPWPDNLIEALKRVREKTKVNFHVFDPKFRQFKERDWVIHHEQMPEAEFDELLSWMDASYAPDPFTEVGRRFAAMSLSTKVVTSICAGLPFIYHGPRDSTVGDLLQQEPLLGIIVESQAPDDIARGITALFTDYPARVAACRSFAQKNYSARVLRAKFLARFRFIAPLGQPA